MMVNRLVERAGFYQSRSVRHITFSVCILFSLAQ